MFYDLSFGCHYHDIHALNILHPEWLLNKESMLFNSHTGKTIISLLNIGIIGQIQ